MPIATALPTSTPPPTATHAPTTTSTATFTATATATNTPTPLPTATATATRTETPKPTTTATITLTPRPIEIVWQENLTSGQFIMDSNARDGFTRVQQFGAKVEIVSDPLNSITQYGNPRGNVIKITTTGDSVELPSWGSGFWVAGYPTMQNGEPRKTVAAPCRVEVDILIPQRLPTYFSLFGVHRLGDITGKSDSVAAFTYRSSTQLRGSVS